MRGAVFFAWFTALFCTIFWLAAAFLVAFPQELTQFEFQKIAIKFMDADHAMERIFIPVLVGVDIFIDWSLGHLRLLGRRAMFSVLAIIFYVVFLIVGPHYSGSYAGDSARNLLLFAIVLIMIPRFGSYLQAPTLAATGNPVPDGPEGD